MRHECSEAARRERGFTLIELLVVIAIVALLVSILLPALREAREAARTVACLSQIRQINMGSHNYAGDNKGFLRAGRVWPPGVLPMYFAWPASYRAHTDEQSEAVFNCPAASRDFWWMRSFDRTSIFARMNPQYRPTQVEYLQEEVPISMNGIRKPREDVAQIGFTYGYNDAGVDPKVFPYGYTGANGRTNFGLGWSVGVPGWDGVALAAIAHPADMIAFGDAASDGTGDASLTPWFRGPWAEPSRRHGGRANTAFVDGHGATEQIEELVVAIPSEPPAGERPYRTPVKHTTPESRARRWNNDHEPHPELWR